MFLLEEVAKYPNRTYYQTHIEHTTNSYLENIRHGISIPSRGCGPVFTLVSMHSHKFVGAVVRFS